jgi:hypothetical protein
MKHTILLIALASSLVVFSCDNDETKSNLNEGLRMHYAFDDGSVVDQSGHYSPGEVINATLIKDRNGKGDSAYYFNEYTDEIILGNVLDDLDEPFTVSVWAKPESENSTALFATQSNLSVYGGFYMFIGTRMFAVRTGDGAGHTLANSRTKSKFSLPDMSGKWTHFCAVVKDVDDFDLYIDGELINAEFDSGEGTGINSNFPDATASIGRFLEDGFIYTYEGGVDDFKIWNRALSAAEVRELSK